MPCPWGSVWLAEVLRWLWRRDKTPMTRHGRLTSFEFPGRRKHTYNLAYAVPWGSTKRFSFVKIMPDSGSVGQWRGFCMRWNFHVLFSTTPVYRDFHFQPGPLKSGKSLRISIDCVAWTWSIMYFFVYSTTCGTLTTRFRSNFGSPGARESPAPNLSAKRLTSCASSLSDSTTGYVGRALKPLSGVQQC